MKQKFRKSIIINKKHQRFDDKEPIAVFGGRDSNQKGQGDAGIQKKMENMELTLKTVNKEKDDILYKLKLMEKEKEEVRINIRHFHERYFFLSHQKIS
jgi:hypothetical protein